MSEHIQHTIDDLRAKRTAIDDLIGRLEEFQREWPITAAAVRPAIVKHVEKASRNGRTDGRTDGRSKRCAVAQRGASLTAPGTTSSRSSGGTAA